MELAPVALPIKNAQDCTYILVVSTLPSFEEANKQLAMTLKDRNPQEGQESSGSTQNCTHDPS